MVSGFVCSLHITRLITSSNNLSSHMPKLPFCSDTKLLSIKIISSILKTCNLNWYKKTAHQLELTK